MPGTNLRYTLRSFRKSPGFTAVAVLSLAFGIGANTAIFSLLDRVLLRALPVRQPDQLMLFTANGPRRGGVDTDYDDTFTFSYPMYMDFRDRAPDMNGVIAWFPAAASLSLNGQIDRVQANLVSGNFFDVLGTGTAIGRPIVPDDARTIGSNPVAVLSYAYWQQKFGGDPAVLNRQVNLNGQSLTVVGVAARGFDGVAMGEAPAIFVPLTMKPQLFAATRDMESRRSMWLNVMGRRKAGVSLAGAESAVNVFWKPILQNELSEISGGSAQLRRSFLNRRITLRDASNGISLLRMMFAAPMTLLMGLVGLVLLIACVNVANLLLARAAGREREIAIRLALGATRGHIARQILGEAVALAMAGGAVGLVFASWGGRWLLAALPFGSYTATITTDPDWRVLAFTAAVSLVCGIGFGLAPVLQTTRTDLASTMKERGASVVSGGLFVRRGLVVVQVALSLVLLTGAGLFLRSLDNLRRLDLGFRPDHLMTFSIQPSLDGYTEARAVTLFDSLRQRLGSLSGVVAVASTQTALLANANWNRGITIPGYTPKEGETAPNVDSVSPGYFATLGMQLVAGREFRESDNAAAPRVAMVNETFARYYFGGASPIGRQFYFGAAAGTPVEIIGLVKDSKYADVREESQRFIFCPYGQQYNATIGAMTYYVRTAREPAAIAPMLRQLVKEADANLPVFDLKTMERQIDEDLFADRIVSQLSLFLGVLATALASIGLYGVMSYAVARRTREIGVRMALGARRVEVVTMVMREVAALTILGIAIAVPLSLPLTNLTKSMLYGVAPHNGWVLATMAGVLALTALAAGAIPASRAARVDPLEALRGE